MTLFVFLSVLMVSMLLGLPVAFALLLSGIAMMVQMDLFSVDILAQSLINGVDSFTLLAIPFFMVAGEVMSRGGLSSRIVALAMTMIGHRKGGLGFVAIITAIVLSGLSGSAVADAAALVSILFPMMMKANYPREHSLGLLASGGLIGPVIPPSLPLILIGVAGNISIGKLLIGGIAPGLMMGAALFVTWWLLMRNEALETLPRASWGECGRAFKDSFWALMLPVIIIGGIRTGAFTATEAAVVAAVYAIFVSMLVYRELDLRGLYDTLVAAGRTTAMVMFLVGAAMVVSWMITVAQLPQQLAALLDPFMDSPRLLMAVIMVIVFLVGTAMDLSPTVLILVPLFMPVIMMAGIDPVYFGLMFVINCSIGLITPPVGTVLNVVCGVSGATMSQAMRGVMPFMIAYLMLLTLFVIFPELITVPLHYLNG
ncbi:dehydroascorbate transporter [Gemmobacter aquaticus]|uniref:TRAP transporter large permease protein n=1 Tax=Gemmobacter aquaticus TaxID=490185 RepID=A0A917YIL8_9RHOB|nr:TRAP transporter large permease subunit [Gemmobacter aquaticus]GGO30017.1 dehydroascorbate transporter [Gemmobacter aquaticus]